MGRLPLEVAESHFSHLLDASAEEVINQAVMAGAAAIEGYFDLVETQANQQVQVSKKLITRLMSQWDQAESLWSQLSSLQQQDQVLQDQAASLRSQLHTLGWRSEGAPATAETEAAPDNIDTPNVETAVSAPANCQIIFNFLTFGPFGMNV